MNEKPLDKFGENVLQQRERRRRRPYFPFPGEILFSGALKAVASTTGPMVYILIVTRQPYPPDAKEIARLKKARLWPPKPVEFGFPQREAAYHGMTEKSQMKGIRELHRVGILDIVHHGSAKRGDFSIFVLSERWKLWDKPGFDARPWPKARFVPERDKVTKQFIRHSRKESMRKLLEANIASITPPVEEGNTSIAPLLEAKSAVNTPLATPILEAKSAVDINLLHRSEGKKRKRGSGRKGGATPIRPDTSSPKWRPPPSEIRENVAEILRQRPDPRADDPQFVRRISDQLWEMLAGRLDLRRVHRDLQAKHDLDDWTTDLLFTIATIKFDFRGATN